MAIPNLSNNNNYKPKGGKIPYLGLSDERRARMEEASTRTIASPKVDRAVDSFVGNNPYKKPKTKLSFDDFKYILTPQAKGLLDSGIKKLFDKTLNTEKGKKTITDITEATTDLPLKAMALSEKVYGQILPFVNEETKKRSYAEVLEDIKNEYDQGPKIAQFSRELSSTTLQTLGGVILNLVPFAGKPLSAGYYGALSAGEQIQDKGEVYSAGNIMIDTAGDMLLGSAVERLLSAGPNKILADVFGKKGATYAQGFITEGITEPSQTLLKYANNFIGAKSQEERSSIVNEAKTYIKDGGLLKEFLIAGLSGGIISGGLGSSFSETNVPPVVDTKAGGEQKKKEETETPVNKETIQKIKKLTKEEGPEAVVQNLTEDLGLSAVNAQEVTNTASRVVAQEALEEVKNQSPEDILSSVNKAPKTQTQQTESEIDSLLGGATITLEEELNTLREDLLDEVPEVQRKEAEEDFNNRVSQEYLDYLKQKDQVREEAKLQPEEEKAKSQEKIKQIDKELDRIEDDFTSKYVPQEGERPEINTAKDAARDLIYSYVKRGDSLQSLKSGQQGLNSSDMSVSVGGYINGKRIPTSKIVVEKYNGIQLKKPEIFSLNDIYKELKEEFEKVEEIGAQIKSEKEARKRLTQKEKVKKSIEEKPKTIKEVAKETGIKEPNIRRILGVGAKEGTFERVDKGVYVLSKDGRDTAYIEVADAVEALPRLAKEGFKADMVFLDIPYDTPAVKGGNRGVKYNLVSVADFGKVLDAVSIIARDQDTPVIHMFSQAPSGMKAMQKYNDLFIEKGFKPVGKGQYQKTFADGSPVTSPNGKVSKPEGILVFTKSGKLKQENKVYKVHVGVDGFGMNIDDVLDGGYVYFDTLNEAQKFTEEVRVKTKDILSIEEEVRPLDLNFTLKRPKGYQTEKPAEMLKAMIEMTTEEGDIVLDPFAGSGVTGAEAVRALRVPYLIEKNKEVAETVTKPRVKEAVDELTTGEETSTIKNDERNISNRGNRTGDGEVSEPVRTAQEESDMGGSPAPVRGRQMAPGESELGDYSVRDGSSSPITSEEIAEILDTKTTINENGEVEIVKDFTELELETLRQYEPAGGRERKGATGRGLLDEYFTDDAIVSMTEDILLTLGATTESGLSVLEPSVGAGNFLSAVKGDNEITGYEINPTTARITKALNPEAVIYNKPFEENFIDGRGNKKDFSEEYDVVIGNPPYGTHRGTYKGLGEEPNIQKYEEYFIKRSLDLTNEGGYVAMVVPSGFLRTASNKAKEAIAKLGSLEVAYRLPNKSFKTTDIGTDIVVFKKATARDNVAVISRTRTLSDDMYFRNVLNMNKILGDQKTRKGKFGEEVFVEGDLNTAYVKFKASEYAFLAEETAEITEEQETVEEVEEIAEAINKESYKPETEVEVLDTVTEELKSEEEVEEVPDSVLKNQKTKKAEKELKKRNSWQDEYRAKTLPEYNQNEAIIASDFFVDSIRELQEDTKDEIEQIWLSKGAKFEVSVSLPFSLGERGITTTFHYSEMPEVQDLTEDVLAYYKEYKADLEGSITSAFQENILEKIQKVLGKEDNIKKILNKKGKKQSSVDEKVTISTPKETTEVLDLATVSNISENERLSFDRTNSAGSLVNTADLEDVFYYKGKEYNRFNYLQGNIYEKLDQLEIDRPEITNPDYEKQKKALLSVLPERMTLDRASISANSSFIKNTKFTVDGEEVGLDSMFIKWLQSLPRQAFGSSNLYDIKDYIREKPVRGGSKEQNAAARKNRRIEGDRLFSLFLQDGLTDNQRQEVEDRYNRLLNGYYRPDYSQVPLIAKLHNTFHGRPLELRDVQKQGVGFLVNKGVGLLAHEVGVGKTLQGIIAIKETMDRGWSKKPLIVVPSASVYKQWVKEIQEVIPDVKINLLANLGGDFKGDINNLNIQDGTISVVTYEGFKKIGFKDETYQALTKDFFDAIADPNAGTERQTEKDIEKAKEKVAKGIKGTQESLLFEDLGFDLLEFDEVHNANHIIGTVKVGDKKDDRTTEFRGLTQRPSELGTKTWLAAQYIQKQQMGRNVYLLSATPFTNNPLEYYSILSLMARNRLKEMGIYNANDFINMFMELSAKYEFKANGSFTETTEVRGHKNYQQFTKLLTEFIDFRDGEEAGVIRPNKIEKKIYVKPTDEQLAYFDEAQELFKKTDEAGTLQAISEFKQTSFSPYASRYFQGKIPGYKKFVEDSPKLKMVSEMIKQNRKDRPDAGQLIYSTIGTEYFPLLKEYLVKEVGFKPHEVDIISGKTSKTKRFSVQEGFNKGDIKVVLGSDAIKEGVNLQKNTTDIYLMSMPWNFTQLKQVIGRGWRHGNRWANIRINNIFTENSIDIFLSQKLENKAKRYEEGLKFRGDFLDTADVDFEEIKFDLVTDPVMRFELERDAKIAEMDNEISKLKADVGYIGRKVEKLVNVKQRINEYERYLRGTDPKTDKSTYEYYEAKLKSLRLDLADIVTDYKGKGIDVDNIQSEMAEKEEALVSKEKELENYKEEAKAKLEEVKKEAPLVLGAEPTDYKAITDSLAKENDGFFEERQAYFQRYSQDDFKNKVFYHGTLENFSNFSKRKRGSNTGYTNASLGFFFIDDPARARQFIEDTRPTGDTRPGRVIEARLDLKNPLDITIANISDPETAVVLYEIATGDVVSEEEAVEYVEMATDMGQIADFYEELYLTPGLVSKLKKKGYDGIISTFGTDYDGDARYYVNEVVVFDEKKIIQKEDPRFSVKTEGVDLETVDLSLRTIEKIRGRDFVSKQFIEDLSKSAELKKQEVEIIRDVLANYEDAENVNVEKFIKEAEQRLLPLRVATFGDVMGVQDVGTHGQAQYDYVTLPEEVRGDVEAYQERVYESPIKIDNRSHFSGVRNYFGHVRVEDMADGKTRRVIEVQSDLYQKGNLEKEMEVPATLIKPSKNRITGEGTIREAKSRLRDLSRLQQYNNPTAHFRMVREEIKQAARDGKAEILFPSGETIMLIEGLNQEGRWGEVADNGRGGYEWRAIGIDDLSVGKEISFEDSDDFIVVEVLGGGRFKAVMPSILTREERAFLKAKKYDQLANSSRAETFNLSGELDTTNPTYKFYEKTLSKYLRSNYDTVEVSDKYKNKWISVRLNKELAELPVMAFNKDNVFSSHRKDEIPGVEGLKRLEWYKRRFKLDFDTVLADTIYTGELKRGKKVEAYGVTFDDSIAFADWIQRTTADHEMVHLVMRHMREMESFKDFTRKEILKEVNGGKDFVPAESADIEEKLAEDYQKFVENREYKGITGKVRRFFEKLTFELEKIFRALRGRHSTVQRFYRELYYGADNSKIRLNNQRLLKKLVSDRDQSLVIDFGRYKGDVITRFQKVLDDLPFEEEYKMRDYRKKDINDILKYTAIANDIYIEDKEEFSAAKTAEEIEERRRMTKQALDQKYTDILKPFYDLKNTPREKVMRALMRGDDERIVWDKTKLAQDFELNEQEIEAYYSVRQAFDVAFDELMAKMKERGVAEEEMQTYRQMQAGYMPHRWEGRYALKTQEIDSEGAWRTVYMETFKTKRALNKALKETEDVKNPNTRFIVDTLDPLEVDFFSEQRFSFENMKAVIEQANTPKEIKEKMVDAIRDAIKEKGFGRHFISRTGVRGYDVDNMPKYIAEYFTGFTGFITKMDAAQKHFINLSTVDARRQKNFYAWLRDYIAFNMGSTKDLNMLKGISFVYYLANDISFLLLNMTQNAVIGTSEISKLFTGAGRILGAEAEIVKATTSWITRQVSADEKRVVEQLLKLGRLGGEMSSELLGFKNNPLYRAYGKGLNYALYNSTAFVETHINRVPAFLAARRVLLRQGLSDTEATNKALEVSDNIHFRYGKAYRPTFMRNKYSNLYFTFSTYTRSWLYLLYQNMKHKDFMAVSKTLFYTFALGGVAGLPMAQLIKIIVKEIVGKHGDDDDKEELTKWEIFLQKGAPAAFLNVDISRNIGVGIMQLDSVLEAAFQDEIRKKDAIRMLGGAFGGIITRVSDGVNLMTQGRLDEGFARVLPDFMGNIFKAYHGTKYGIHTISGNPLKDPETGDNFYYTSNEGIAKALGFTPARESLAWDATRKEWDALDAQAEARAPYRLEIKALVARGKLEEARAVQDEAKALGVIADTTDYIRPLVETSVYKETISIWQSGEKTEQRLSAAEKSIAQKLYGEGYSRTQLNNVSREFGFYRYFGFDNDWANRVREAGTNADKLRVLNEAREALGVDAFREFFNTGRKTVTYESGYNGNILISDNLKEMYLGQE